MSGWRTAAPLPPGRPSSRELTVTGVIVGVATVALVVLLLLAP